MLSCLTAVLCDDECVVLKTDKYRNGPAVCRIGRQLNRVEYLWCGFCSEMELMAGIGAERC